MVQPALIFHNCPWALNYLISFSYIAPNNPIVTGPICLESIAVGNAYFIAPQSPNMCDTGLSKATLTQRGPKWLFNSLFTLLVADKETRHCLMFTNNYWLLVLQCIVLCSELLFLKSIFVGDFRLERHGLLIMPQSHRHWVDRMDQNAISMSDSWKDTSVCLRSTELV